MNIVVGKIFYNNFQGRLETSTNHHNIHNKSGLPIFLLRNYVSGTDTQTRNELPTLVGVLTSEAPPSALPWVGSSLHIGSSMAYRVSDFIDSIQKGIDNGISNAGQKSMQCPPDDNMVKSFYESSEKEAWMPLTVG